ncbi:hypothetical protein NW768_004052 [Fusarium equiseti]|uniref:Uncharacterized protein n=1 Tax=Fusarium equiseti TaxID=61235 RepID=A0ABQ8RJE4_FUSEQ|nr:hypothetical protein NW768_004052 [Fusarium equiseti]
MSVYQLIPREEVTFFFAAKLPRESATTQVPLDPGLIQLFNPVSTTSTISSDDEPLRNAWSWVRGWGGIVSETTDSYESLAQVFRKMPASVTCYISICDGPSQHFGSFERERFEQSKDSTECGKWRSDSFIEIVFVLQRTLSSEYTAFGYLSFSLLSIFHEPPPTYFACFAFLANRPILESISGHIVKMPYQPNPNFEPEPHTEEVYYPAWGTPNRSARRRIPVTCPNCLRQGHEIAKCMIPRSDGYVHGCALCNSSTHQTDDCRQLSRMHKNDMLDLFISNRANMPPLLATNWWYLSLYVYKYFMGPTIEDGYPWTPEFGISVLNDPDLQIWATDAMELGAFWMRPIDPRMSSWEKVQETFGGIPPDFRKMLECPCYSCEEYLRELEEILHETPEEESGP